MNKRIDELFGQSLDAAVPETWSKLDSAQLHRLKEKFAQLIVQDCMNVCMTMKLIGPHKELQAATLEDAATEIKYYFGLME